MKIIPISFYNINSTKATKQQTRTLFAPAYDTVRFKSHNFLDLPKAEVYKRIQASLNSENFIGQGTEAEVYRIKDTDFCVKIPYEALGFYTRYKDEDIKKLYFDKNINSADAVNYVKIKLFMGGTVMNYINGVKPKDYIYDMAGRYKFQSDVAQMPIKSYTELIHQISNGLDNEMLFDCSAGNLIVDSSKNKLTAIDFIPIKENPRDISVLKEIYSVITTNGAEQGTGKKIFEKIMLAGLNEFMPKQAPCMDVELFDFVELCQKRIQETGAANTNRLIQKVSQQINLIKNMKKTEYMNAIFSKFIGEKIEEVKGLIKYIK